MDDAVGISPLESLNSLREQVVREVCAQVPEQTVPRRCHKLRNDSWEEIRIFASTSSPASTLRSFRRESSSFHAGSPS